MTDKKLLQKIEVKKRKLEIKKEIARLESNKDLISFCKYTDRYYTPSSHHRLIWEKLQQVEKGDIKRLIITMPPRHWKSRLASQEFPAWYLGSNPNKNVMISSYSASLAESFSRKTRERVRSDEFNDIFNVTLKEDSQNIKHWETKDNWWFIAAWVWWSITGKWFHLGIIDDPISNREEAESQLIRDKIWDWYTSTFYTRQEKDAAIIVIMTRWHEDDLVWRLVENMNRWWEKWEVLHLKAINDQWEALWDDKYNLTALEAIKNSIWPRDFNSLYQWEPFDEEWWAFNKDMFQYYDYSAIKNKELTVLTFVDPAISLKQSWDYTAIVTIWQDNNNQIFILDVFRERVEPDDLFLNLFRIADEWKPDRIWIESVAFQKMLILEFKKQMELRNKFYTLDEVRPMGEKEARIKAILQPRYSNHNIFHKHWLEDLETELLRFPSSKHDDQIDALSWAVKLLEVNYWTSSVDYESALSNYLN